MNIIKDLTSEKLVEALKEDGIAIIPTDTIYGLVGLASSKKATDRIYKLKGRNKDKPFIFLISSYEDLPILNINFDENIKKIVSKYWPGKVSIVFRKRQ